MNLSGNGDLPFEEEHWTFNITLDLRQSHQLQLFSSNPEIQKNDLC